MADGIETMIMTDRIEGMSLETIEIPLLKIESSISSLGDQQQEVHLTLQERPMQGRFSQ